MLFMLYIDVIYLFIFHIRYLCPENYIIHPTRIKLYIIRKNFITSRYH